MRHDIRGRFGIDQINSSEEMGAVRSACDARIGRGGRFAQTVGVVATVLYVFAFFVVLPRDWRSGWVGHIEVPRDWLNAFCAEIWVRAGVANPGWMLRHGTYCVLVGIVVPWFLLAVVGRGRPRDFGIRRPNIIAWRMLSVCIIGSMPLLYWMVGGAGFADYYGPHLALGASAFLTYYSANMISEHFLFHGVMLATLRRGRRWPEPATVCTSPASGWVRPLRWIGLAQPSAGERGARRITAWFGLPPECVCGVVVSGLLFGAAHIGKDGREFLLSFPGGMASAYIAYRTNSAVVPFLLHAATAGAACIMMVLLK